MLSKTKVDNATQREVFRKIKEAKKRHQATRVRATVSRPKSPLGLVAVAVMVFVPTANGTDMLNPVLQGNLKPAIKHSSPVSSAVPLPPAELLQVTEVAVAERDPETVTVAAHVGPVFVGDSIVINPGISLGRSSAPTTTAGA